MIVVVMGAGQKLVLQFVHVRESLGSRSRRAGVGRLCCSSPACARSCEDERGALGSDTCAAVRSRAPPLEKKHEGPPAS